MFFDRVHNFPLKGTVVCDIMEVERNCVSVVTQPIKDNLMLCLRSTDRLGSNTGRTGVTRGFEAMAAKEFIPSYWLNFPETSAQLPGELYLSSNAKQFPLHSGTETLCWSTADKAAFWSSQANEARFLASVFFEAFRCFEGHNTSWTYL